jgi:hypothetical protein
MDDDGGQSRMVIISFPVSMSSSSATPAMRPGRREVFKDAANLIIARHLSFDPIDVVEIDFSGCGSI